MRQPGELPPIGPAIMSGVWWVLQVFNQHERSAAAALNKLDVGYYLPLMEIVAPDSQGKSRRTIKPLFPGYIFACCQNEAAFGRAIDLESVYGWLQVFDQVRLRVELEQLFRAFSQRQIIYGPEALRHGTLWRVRKGHNLADCTGIVVPDDQGKHRLMLQVSILGRAIPIEIEPQYLEPAT